MALWKRLFRRAGRGEKCHYVGRASWYEMPGLVRTDVGIVYFTSHRIIFDGLQGRKSIRLASLSGMKVLPEGIGLSRRKMHRVIGIDGDIEKAAAVLNALLANR